MNKPVKHSPSNEAAHACRSKSLDLEGIRTQLLVNSMKIKLEQQRLLTAVLPGATPIETAVETNISRIETLMQYATLAVTTYRMVKKGIGIFKSFKN